MTTTKTTINKRSARLLGEWESLPAITPDALSFDDLHRPAYVLASLDAATWGDPEAEEGQRILEVVPCTIVNFTEATLTIRFTSHTRELYSLALEYIICAPGFIRWATPEETARWMAGKEEFSYDDGI